MPQKGYTQLSYYQRLYLKDMLDKNLSKVLIAERLHVHRSTVFNEIKRGSVNGVYDPEYREEQAREKAVKREAVLKADKQLAEYVARLILEEHLSPERIVEHFKEEEHGFAAYPTSPVTIYTAIDMGWVPNVTRDDLNANIDADITTVINDSIRIPAYIRRKLKIKHGDKFRFECKKNGTIVIRKVK